MDGPEGANVRDALGAPQTIAVFGGTSEIGIAIAKNLAGPRQAHVVLAGRDMEGLEKAAASVREAGASAVDIASFDADATETHEAALVDVLSHIGDLDVAVIAFGLLGNQEEGENDPRAALQVARTNYLGAMSICLHLGWRMKQQGHGTIIVLSSVAGERARRSNFIYGSSKAGIDTFAQGLSDALEGTGASLLVVRPGFVRTKMTAGMKAAPLSVTADEVAAVVARALHIGEHTVWAPTPMRWVMAVLRHLPRAVFRRLPI
jgi:decaprenylphospho-beta-D-erythro-pentofuranosid-2-ulose 2-reductase